MDKQSSCAIVKRRKMHERHRSFRYFGMVLFYVFVISPVEINSNGITRIKKFKMVDNISLGFSFLKVRLPTYLQCAKLCYSYKICGSGQFYIKTGECRLNLVSVEDVSWAKINARNVLFDRYDIPKELAGECMDHNCDLNSLCVEKAGIASCVTMFNGSECDLPFPLPYASSQNTLPVLPGETVVLKCISPLRGNIWKATCNQYGEWIFRISPECKADFCDTLYIIVPNYESGVYEIQIGEWPQTVYCDADTDGGDWLVIQRRLDMSFGYNRSETSYIKGFGEVNGNFWIGTATINNFTSFADMELRIEFKVSGNETVHYATYNQFFVGTGDTNFCLTIDRYIDGNCGDGLSYLNGLSFNVTEDGFGGWWRNDTCNGTNLNAEEGVLKWSTGCDGRAATVLKSIATSRLMIRRKS